jgi:hypothetical protein
LDAFQPITALLMKICVFVSDHGFGHAARSCHIIRELLKVEGVQIVVISGVPRFLFEEFSECINFSHIKRRVDVGVVQDTSISINIVETYNSLVEFWDEFDDCVNDITEELSKLCIDGVIFDITPIGPRIASKLSVPSIAISNFSWDWIYGAFMKEDPRFGDIIAKISQNYMLTTIFLQYPYGAPLDSFSKSKIEQVGWISAISKLQRDQIRTFLGWNDDKYLLFTFGGHSFEELFRATDDWKVPEGYKVIIYHATIQAQLKVPNVFSMNRESSLPLQYIDLIEGSDVIVIKPGFGTVSECIVNRKKVLYTKRGNFIEQDLLIQALEENTTCSQVDSEEILQCRPSFFEKASKLLSSPISHKVHRSSEVEIAKTIMDHLTSPFSTTRFLNANIKTK